MRFFKYLKPVPPGGTGGRKIFVNLQPSDSERVRTGIERFDFDENPSQTGAIVLRDMRTDLPNIDYSTVNVEVEVGNDVLTGMVHLIEKRPGSGRWRFDGTSVVVVS